MAARPQVMPGGPIAPVDGPLAESCTSAGRADGFVGRLRVALRGSRRSGVEELALMGRREIGVAGGGLALAGAERFALARELRGWLW